MKSVTQPIQQFAATGPKLGETPPLLRLTQSVQGPPADEISWDKLRGKVVVLEFWSTWCGPCVRSIPHLNDLAERFAEKPVQFIAVTAENEAVVREFLTRQPLKPWVALDDYEALNKAFGVKGIPHTVVVDANGRIAAITHRDSLKRMHLEEILSGKPCSLPPPATDEEKLSADNKTVPNVKPPLFEISIRPSVTQKPHGPFGSWDHEADLSGFTGKTATVQSALDAVFGTPLSRMWIGTPLPGGYYDFRLKVPPGQNALLEAQFIQALRSVFGLEVKRSRQLMDAYRLRVVTRNGPGLRAVAEPGGGGQTAGGFKFSGAPMAWVAECLEHALRQPVIDETGLIGRFAVDMKWQMSEAELMPSKLDPRVLRALEDYPETKALQELPPELVTGDAGRHLEAMLAELKKPEWEQFKPEQAAVIKAAHERLGLELVPVKETLDVLQVSRSSERMSLE